MPSPDLNDLEDVTRFNEATDQSLINAAASYPPRRSASSNVFGDPQP
jgi:hypothetical protein